MAAAYSVRRLPPAEAQESAARIWRDNLPLSTDAHATFTWKYLCAPEPAAVHCLLTVATDGGTSTVGSSGICPRPFTYRGQPLRAALFADLAVDRAHRTLTPALTLLRASVSEALSGFEFAYGFPNELSVGLFLRAGFQRLGTMTRYACVLRHRVYLQRRLTSPLLSALASLPLDLLRLAPLKLRQLATSRRYRLVSGGDVDPQLDSLRGSLRDELPLLGARGAAWLRWQHFSTAQRGAELHQLYRKGHTLRGYAITRNARGVTQVLDLLAAPGELPILLDHLLLAARRGGTASVSLAFLGAPQFVSTLRSRGFVARESEQTVVYARGHAASLPFDPADASQWFLTEADQDV